METSTEAPKYNGSRLAVLRMRRGLTQRQLADVVGYSLSAIKKFESGHRSLDQASLILMFSRVLECHPTEITGQPVISDRHDREDGHLTVAALRRELLRYDRVPKVTEHAAAAVSLPELRTRIERMNVARQAAALTRVGAELPGLLADLRVAAHVLEGTARETVYGLLADGYAAAEQVLYKLGYCADATSATERVRWASARCGDRLQVLASEWYYAGEFMMVGAHAEAADIINDSLGELDQLAGRDSRAMSLYGMFQLKRALNAARSFDESVTWEAWGAADKAATCLGRDRNDFQLCFGPTNVAIWSVSLPVELGQGREAIRRGENAVARMPHSYGAERHSHLYIDMGRGHFYAGQRAAAHAAFLQAEAIAPQQTRNHAGVQETVRTMIAERARSGSLVEFGMRVGVV